MEIINYPISAELFWRKFREKVLNNIIFNELWRNPNGSKNAEKWTNYIIDEALTELGKNLGFQEHDDYGNGIQKEYFNIDLGFYRNYKKIENIGWNWDFEVAIEHENDPKTWLVEFAKLLHINAGLKVIISYFDYDNCSEDELAKMFRIAGELLKMRRYRSREDNFLIIIGPFSTGNENRKQSFRAFKLYGEKFIEISSYENDISISNG